MTTTAQGGPALVDKIDADNRRRRRRGRRGDRCPHRACHRRAWRRLRRGDGGSTGSMSRCPLPVERHPCRPQPRRVRGQLGDPAGTGWRTDRCVGPTIGGDDDHDAENKAVLITTAEPTVRLVACPNRSISTVTTGRAVLVIDTGLRTASNGEENEPEHAFLRSVRPAPTPRPPPRRVAVEPGVDALDDEDEPDDDRSGLLDFEAGHGTFITGIVRQICPDAVVHPAGVLSSFGEGSLARVRSTIRRMNRSCGPFDVVVMSFGTFCTDDEPGLLGSWLPACSATPSESRPPATCSRAARTSRQRCPGSSVSEGWTVADRHGSPTSAAGSTPALRRSTSSARSSTTSPSGTTVDRSATSRVGPLERDQLRCAEGRRGHRPGDVRARSAPGRRGGAVVDHPPAECQISASCDPTCDDRLRSRFCSAA